MLTAKAARYPLAPNTGEIREFMISPPRSPAFAGKAWEVPLGTYLGRLFPDLILHVSASLPFRDLFDVSVLPVAGRFADAGDPGFMNPVTDKTRLRMEQIAAAVEAYDPAVGPPRPH